jgi:outer membrane protein assembly factor BamB
LRQPNADDGELLSFAVDGSPRWNLAAAAGFAYVAPTLADDGTLFAVNVLYSCNVTQAPAGWGVSAFDGDAGALLWSTAPIFAGETPHLAVSPSASLLFSGSDGIRAYFAGRVRPQTAAPWSRERGGNANRGAPAR